jgi:hypothetical protein
MEATLKASGGGGMESLGSRGGGGCIAMHIRRQHRSCGSGGGVSGRD